MKETSYHFIFNEKCNQNCIFCSYDRSRINKIDFSYEQIVGNIKSLPYNSDEVIIDGGEPTIRRDFFKLVRLIELKKPKKVTLCTNGLLLSYDSFADRISRSCINNVLVSLHSQDSEVADKTTQLVGSFDKTRNGLLNLKKRQVNTSISFVINKLNYKDIMSFVRFVKQDFPDFNVSFSFVRATGNAKLNSWIVPKISEVVPYLIEPLDYCQKNNVHFSFTSCSIPPCFLEGYQNYSGEVLLKQKQFVVSRNHNEQIREFNNEKTKSEECKQCIYDNICGGLWNEYVSIYGTSELKPTVSNAYVALGKDYVGDLKMFEEVIGKLDLKNNIDLVYDYFWKK